MLANNRLAATVVATLGLLCLGTASASAQSIRMFVAGPHGVDEVREGAGTGGRFVAYSPARNVNGLTVGGYTDRASRGDFMFVLIEGTGVLQYVTLKSDNYVLNWRWDGVALPNYMFGRVWLNPNVDNVYITAKLPGKNVVSKRVPIGTR